MTSYEEIEPEPPRGWSPGVVALVATLLLLLGLGGAFLGIYLADSSTPSATPTTLPAGFPTDTAGPVEPTESATSNPTVTPTPSGAASPPANTDVFALPAVTGMDFREARSNLRALKLGVNLVFQGTQEGDYTVSDTTPKSGALVTKGVTVTLVVKGSAPEATVPMVIGLDCKEAAALIVDQGLFPSYPNGKAGSVVQQDPPAPPSQPVYWNQTVKIWCGGGPTPEASG